MSSEPRDSSMDAAFMRMAVVCSMLAWVPFVDLTSGEPLSVDRVIAIAFRVLVWWPCVFFFGLIMRDTTRQGGKWAINLKRPVCSQCGMPLRRMRFLSCYQWIWDGWTCHECGFEMKWGRPVKEQNALARWTVLRALGESNTREHQPQLRDERIRNVNDQMRREKAP
jgi:ribosomal protein L37E